MSVFYSQLICTWNLLDCEQVLSEERSGCPVHQCSVLCLLPCFGLVLVARESCSNLQVILLRLQLLGKSLLHIPQSMTSCGPQYLQTPYRVSQRTGSVQSLWFTTWCLQLSSFHNSAPAQFSHLCSATTILLITSILQLLLLLKCLWRILTIKEACKQRFYPDPVVALPEALLHPNSVPPYPVFHSLDADE